MQLEWTAKWMNQELKGILQSNVSITRINHPFGNGLYQLYIYFDDWVMVYYCYVHIRLDDGFRGVVLKIPCLVAKRQFRLYKALHRAGCGLRICLCLQKVPPEPLESHGALWRRKAMAPKAVNRDLAGVMNTLFER